MPRKRPDWEGAQKQEHLRVNGYKSSEVTRQTTYTMQPDTQNRGVWFKGSTQRKAPKMPESWTSLDALAHKAVKYSGRGYKVRKVTAKGVKAARGAKGSAER